MAYIFNQLCLSVHLYLWSIHSLLASQVPYLALFDQILSPPSSQILKITVTVLPVICNSISHLFNHLTLWPNFSSLIQSLSSPSLYDSFISPVSSLPLKITITVQPSLCDPIVHIQSFLPTSQSLCHSHSHSLNTQLCCMAPWQDTLLFYKSSVLLPNLEDDNCPASHRWLNFTCIESPLPTTLSLSLTQTLTHHIWRSLTQLLDIIHSSLFTTVLSSLTLRTEDTFHNCPTSHRWVFHTSIISPKPFDQISHHPFLIELTSLVFLNISCVTPNLGYNNCPDRQR